MLLSAFFALGTATLAFAGSHRPPPLHSRALSYPDGLTIDLIPRRDLPSTPLLSRRHTPRWDDRFLLSFVSHGQPITLSLRPSTTLVQTTGFKEVHTHTDANGERTTNTRFVPRERIRAYEGWVLPEEVEYDEFARQRWVNEEIAGLRREADSSNWARITFHDSPEEVEEAKFGGAFAVNDELYTIHPTETYLRVKDAVDPMPPMLQRRNAWGNVASHPRMVIVRERDVLSPLEHIAELRKRGMAIPDPEVANAGAIPVSTCGHDHLPFNTDPSHPVYENALNQAVFDDPTSPWLTSVFGMPSRGAPPPSFSRKDNVVATAYGYPPPRPRLARRQSDVAGSNGNASSNFINSIGSTSGCPKSAMVLFLGVAADCTFTAQFPSTDAARESILTDFNAASSLYQSSFNISLGIVELNVQSGACPTTSAAVDRANPWNVGCVEGGGPGLDLNSRLSVFSAWRGAKGGADRAGLWHLMTNCSTGSEVGVAWLGQLCRVSASTSSTGDSTSGTGVTSITRSIWQVISHEIGHSFGAIHDCATGCSLRNSNPICCPLTTSSCDASANFIMSPVSQKNVSAFSPCSIGNICSSLGNSLNTTCLATPEESTGVNIISLQSCGNGIVEAGEDCDPGSNTEDSCCDAKTCKFVSGAVCDPLNSLCCTSTCQIAGAGTVCRPSVDARCDKAETCSGTDPSCPADAFTNDGTSCGPDQLACASGVCTSRSAQCQTAGISLNLTAACPTRASESCSITCQDPTNAADCVVLEQSFRDGSPCGYAGRCANSECKQGNALAVAKSWYRQNLQIAIPVTVVAGVIVILLLLALFRCCTRRRQTIVSSKVPASARYMSSAAPPVMSSHRRSGGSRQAEVPFAGTASSSQQHTGAHNSASSLGPLVPPPSRSHQSGRNEPGGQYGAYAPSLPPQPQHGHQQGYGGGDYQGNAGWVDPSQYNSYPQAQPNAGWR